MPRKKKTETGNHYIRINDIWIRDFTRKEVAPVSLTNLYAKDDHETVIYNEEKNKACPKISEEKINFENIIIVSDGYNFESKMKTISQIKVPVCILAVNGALKKWDFSLTSKNINAYIINHPGVEAFNFMPNQNSYYPTCIASTRTNRVFCQQYKGDVYTYQPTPNYEFGPKKDNRYTIDDYRNSICAAIGLAFEFNVRKLMLFACDFSFEENKERSVRLENSLYTYPQHIYAQQIIDGNLYWLKECQNRQIKVADYSHGIKLINAEYIEIEQDVCNFFSIQED